mgnify:FL=1
MTKIRTDLALEAGRLSPDAPEIPGVVFNEEKLEGLNVTVVRITTDNAAEVTGKPIGSYATLTLPDELILSGDSFRAAAAAGAELLRRFLPGNGPYLVAGLGNEAVTPDTIGPSAVEKLIVTRHLKNGGQFSQFGSVAAIAPGVLGETGIESGEIINSVSGCISPAAVIVVDALASRGISRICRTIQISDSGIIPGSGVGNARRAIDKGLLGVPVISVGIPTVVDAATICIDLAAEAGSDDISEEALRKYGGDMIVTPRDIDRRVEESAKLLSYCLNLALHPSLTYDDVTAFFA